MKDAVKDAVQDFKDYMQSIGVNGSEVDMMTNIVRKGHEDIRKELKDQFQEAFNRELVEAFRLMRRDIYKLEQLEDMIKEAEEQFSEVLKKKREAKNYIPVKKVERQKNESKKTVTEEKTYNFRL